MSEKFVRINLNKIANYSKAKLNVNIYIYNVSVGENGCAADSELRPIKLAISSERNLGEEQIFEGNIAATIHTLANSKAFERNNQRPAKWTADDRMNAQKVKNA